MAKSRSRSEFLVRLLQSYVSSEDASTLALILARLEPDLSAQLFRSLSHDTQHAVFARLAAGDFSDPAPEKVAAILIDLVIDESGGPSCAADVLNRTDPHTERRILTELDQKDATLAESVRNAMFTFDDIVHLTDREIQAVLRETDSRDLALALKSASPEAGNRVFSNLSERVGGIIKHEMDHSGPVRRRDILNVQRKIVCTVRQLEEAGQIQITTSEGSEFV